MNMQQQPNQQFQYQQQQPQQQQIGGALKQLQQPLLQQQQSAPNLLQQPMLSHSQQNSQIQITSQILQPLQSHQNSMVLTTQKSDFQHPNQVQPTTTTNNNNTNTHHTTNSTHPQKEKKEKENKEKESKVNMRTKHVNKYYKVLEEVGSGAYGRVYKAECLKTKQLVALKKFESNDDKTSANGFPITGLREIKILKQLNHENIIKLREIIVTKPSERNRFRGSTFMVFDYMHHDFAGLAKMKYSYSYPQIKNIMKQILQGVKYLHDSHISHRDLKTANILLNNRGQVKIADFGLARNMPNNPHMQYTVKVVTLWYRAPELLLGMKKYSTQIDMWSVGCILSEFLCGSHLLQGDGEIRQLEKIYELCGSPDEKSWPGVSQLPGFKEFQLRQYPKKLKDAVLKRNPQIDDIGIDLLDGLLTLNPSKRLTADQALAHPFFSSNPLPEHLNLDTIEECHEMTLGKKYKKKQQPQNVNIIAQNQVYKQVDDDTIVKKSYQYSSQQQQQQQQQQPNYQRHQSNFQKQFSNPQYKYSGNNINPYENNNNNKQQQQAQGKDDEYSPSQAIEQEQQQYNNRSRSYSNILSQKSQIQQQEQEQPKQQQSDMGLIGLASLLGPAPTTTTDSNLKRSHSQLGENNANDPEPSKKSKI